MDTFLIISGLLVVGGLIVLAIRKVRPPSGSGSFLQKPGKREPSKWRVMRRKQFKGEAEFESDGRTRKWYFVSEHFTASDAELAAANKRYVWTNVLIEVHPVYADKEG